MRLIDRRELIGSLPLVAALGRRAVAQSALLPFIELDHVSIRVSDVQHSARFYMQLFGNDAARDPKTQANPGSQTGELWFIRLGRSHLALAPLSPNEVPGVDHYCLSVSAFAKDTARARLAQFDQPYPEWPSNNVWLRDRTGSSSNLPQAQMTPNWPRSSAMRWPFPIPLACRQHHHFAPSVFQGSCWLLLDWPPRRTTTAVCSGTAEPPEIRIHSTLARPP